jgi:hypothetical protein
MTREELIQELEAFIHSLSEKQLKATVNAVNKKGLMNTDWDDIGCSFGAEDLADFILSRERLLLEKIIEPMKKINPNWDGYVWIHDDYYTPIPKNLTRFNLREHLAIIEKEGGE